MDRTNNSEEGGSLHEVIPAEVRDPTQISEKKEAKERLMDAIKELNERDRLIITLYYFENLNYREIAEVLDISVSRISQIHSRILESLKEKLEEVDA